MNGARAWLLTGGLCLLSGLLAFALVGDGIAPLFSHMASALLFASPLNCWFAPGCR